MLEWFKKLGVKVKIAFGVILGILGFVFFFFIREKMRAREKLNYELDRLRHQIKITELGKNASAKESTLNDLRREEALLREKLKLLDEIEDQEQREVSIEELDAFFDERGF